MTLPKVALTLIQPWGTLIVSFGKDIENRTWIPPVSLLRPGERLWIHAGKKLDRDEHEWQMDVLPGYPKEVPLGALLGHVRFEGVVRESDSQWFNGPFGWKLADPIALPTPILCKGAQGVWAPPADVVSGWPVWP